MFPTGPFDNGTRINFDLEELVLTSNQDPEGVIEGDDEPGVGSIHSSGERYSPVSYQGRLSTRSRMYHLRRLFLNLIQRRQRHASPSPTTPPPIDEETLLSLSSAGIPSATTNSRHHMGFNLANYFRIRRDSTDRTREYGGAPRITRPRTPPVEAYYNDDRDDEPFQGPEEISLTQVPPLALPQGETAAGIENASDFEFELETTVDEELQFTDLQTPSTAIVQTQEILTPEGLSLPLSAENRENLIEQLLDGTVDIEIEEGEDDDEEIDLDELIIQQSGELTEGESEEENQGQIPPLEALPLRESPPTLPTNPRRRSLTNTFLNSRTNSLVFNSVARRSTTSEVYRNSRALGLGTEPKQGSTKFKDEHALADVSVSKKEEDENSPVPDIRTKEADEHETRRTTSQRLRDKFKSSVGRARDLYRMLGGEVEDIISLKIPSPQNHQHSTSGQSSELDVSMRFGTLSIQPLSSSQLDLSKI